MTTQSPHQNTTVNTKGKTDKIVLYDVVRNTTKFPWPQGSVPEIVSAGRCYQYLLGREGT